MKWRGSRRHLLFVSERDRRGPAHSAALSIARIAGIHAGVDQWTDGSIVAVGRGDAISDRMPLSTSRDGGVSWTYSPSPFPPIAGGQFSVLRRLRENVFMLVSFTTGSTFTSDTGAEFEGQGMFAALSEGGGKTWPTRKLLTDVKHRTLDGHAWTDMPGRIDSPWTRRAPSQSDTSRPHRHPTVSFTSSAAGFTTASTSPGCVSRTGLPDHEAFVAAAQRIIDEPVRFTYVIQFVTTVGCVRRKQPIPPN